MALKDSSRDDLPGTASKSESGVTTPDLVAEEKDLQDHNDGEKVSEQIETPLDDSEEYPTGGSLVFIIISLVLSVFLVALDMVRCYHQILTGARY
jgi:hypothetical protein